MGHSTPLPPKNINKKIKSESTFPRLFIFNRTTLSIVNKKHLLPCMTYRVEIFLKMFLNFHKNKEVILPLSKPKNNVTFD